MQRINLILLLTIIFFSCKEKLAKDSFTINGELKNFATQKIYVEQLFFNGKDPYLIDSGVVNNHTFSIPVKANEEGLYRLRFAGNNMGFIFINDSSDINFTADSTDLSLDGPSFNTPANNSLKKFIRVMDSLRKELITSNTTLKQLQENGVRETDSSFITALNNFDNTKEKIAAFCFQYGDTTSSPILAIFAITSAPVEIKKLEASLDKTAKRFPAHNGIAGAITFAKQKIAAMQQQIQGSSNKVSIGSIAPDITMPDVNGNPFSLSMLRGKYVLIDFWASWCGPCRAENPNVVAAYNEFKNKNFTILGVSLDKNKDAWLEAIKEDGLEWKQISDLQFWNSAAVSLYGFDAIPFNVLVDPEGKVIATDLREEGLHTKLKEVLK